MTAHKRSHSSLCGWQGRDRVVHFEMSRSIGLIPFETEALLGHQSSKASALSLTNDNPLAKRVLSSKTKELKTFWLDPESLQIREHGPIKNKIQKKPIIKKRNYSKKNADTVATH